MRAVGALATLAALVGPCIPVQAHRLDEYLQAMRVDVRSSEIAVALDLTPGILIAPGVLATLDANDDRLISDNEARAYALEVMGAVHVTLDGAPLSLSLDRYEFPAFDDVKDGTGVIRLQATAAGASPHGRHRLVVRNDHRPDISVYLANALLPVGSAVGISSQTRDPLQRGLSIEYTVERPRSAGAAVSWMMCAAALLGVLAWRRDAAPRVRRVRL
jgi:hypothetical protein